MLKLISLHWESAHQVSVAHDVDVRAIDDNPHSFMLLAKDGASEAREFCQPVTLRVTPGGGMLVVVMGKPIGKEDVAANNA